MSRFKSVILRVCNECAGVALGLGSDDEFCYRITIVRRINGRLKIRQQLSVDSINDLKTIVSKNTPIVLSIDGYGIIHKQIGPGADSKKPYSFMPDIKNSDIYTQRIEQGEQNDTIISIGRKDKIDDIITSFNREGYYPFDVILGPFNTVNLAMMQNEDNEVSIPGYKFLINDDSHFSFRKDLSETERNFMFGDINVNSEYLLSLANSVSFFSQQVITDNNILIAEEQKDEFIYKKSYTVLGIGILTMVFILLVINTMLFSSYRAENQTLTATIEYNKEFVTRIDSLKDAIKEQTALAEMYGYKESQLYSYYCDRIASIIPQYVTMTSININPALKSSGSTRRIGFLRGAIELKGIITGTGDLDLMIKRISSFSWVKNVEIKQYADTGKEPAVFFLNVTLK